MIDVCVRREVAADLTIYAKFTEALSNVIVIRCSARHRLRKINNYFLINYYSLFTLFHSVWKSVTYFLILFNYLIHVLGTSEYNCIVFNSSYFHQ